MNSVTVPQLLLTYAPQPARKLTGLAAVRAEVNRKRLALGKPPLVFAGRKASPKNRPGRRADGRRGTKGPAS